MCYHTSLFTVCKNIHFQLSKPPHFRLFVVVVVVAVVLWTTEWDSVLTVSSSSRSSRSSNIRGSSRSSSSSGSHSRHFLISEDSGICARCSSSYSLTRTFFLFFLEKHQKQTNKQTKQGTNRQEKNNGIFRAVAKLISASVFSLSLPLSLSLSLSLSVFILA